MNRDFIPNDVIAKVDEMTKVAKKYKPINNIEIIDEDIFKDRIEQIMSEAKKGIGFKIHD